MRRLGSRSYVIDGPDGPEVRIRPPHRPFWLIASTLWMAAWAAVSARALKANQSDPSATAFMTRWLLVYLLAEACGMIQMAYTVFGYEVASVTRNRIRVGRGIGGFTLGRSFPVHECMDLRAVGWDGSRSPFAALLRPNREPR